MKDDEQKRNVYELADPPSHLLHSCPWAAQVREAPCPQIVWRNNMYITMTGSDNTLCTVNYAKNAIYWRTYIFSYFCSYPIPTVSTTSTSPELLNRDHRECDQFNQAVDAPRSPNHVEITYLTIY